jgi:hypothetical protein
MRAILMYLNGNLHLILWYLILLKKGSIFLESYTNYDLTVLEEFESLFPSKVQELIPHDKFHLLEEMVRVEKLELNTKLKT